MPDKTKNNQVISLRRAYWTDLQGIVDIMDANGYPYKLEDVSTRLKYIFFSPNFHSIVAEIEDNIAGCIILEKTFTFEITDTYTRVIVFGVNKNYQNKGIGRVLLKEIEKWAIEQQTNGILMITRLSHQHKGSFQYLVNHGFEHHSTGYLKKI
jgi:N-acetylglutamate synthase-like GNAT family acetyltransferase